MSFVFLNTGRGHVRLAVLGAGAVALAAVIAGCGSEYRPVVTPIGPSGPPAQPGSLVAVVSYTGANSPGVATIVNYSGDTIAAQAPIGVGPLAFTVDQGGSTGYTINSDGTLTNFPVSSSLQAKNVNYTTLPANSQPQNIFSPSSGLWVPDVSGNQVDVFNGAPISFRLAIPVAPTPVSIGGPEKILQRYFAISDNFSDPTGVACNVNPHALTQNGEVDALETGTYSVSARIATGVCPVFGVTTPDTRRLFVLNRGSDTITVINSELNSLDSCTPFKNQNGQWVYCHPSLPLSTTAGLTGVNVPALAGPVYAEYNAATSQLIVADYDGASISVIDVSLDEYGNDGPSFGTTYTIPVGKNPAGVTALYDGTRAYTANQTDQTVTVVNLTSHSVEKTLAVNGHPRTVASTQNSTQGKVYVASPDSPYLTIIRTDQDIVGSTVLVQGNILDVRVTSANAAGANTYVQTRRPGYGQPCFLPPGLVNLTSDPGACRRMQ